MNILPLISRIIFSGLRRRRSRSVIRAAVCAVLVAAFSSPLLAENTIVRMEIYYGNAPAPAGNIDIELYDDEAPKTVLNFLSYAGYYYHLRYTCYFIYCNYAYNAANPIIIHRIAHQDLNNFSTPKFAIQGGGYYFMGNSSGSPLYDAIPGPSVQNEYSPAHPNTVGAIAMALSTGPDSATGQWFINLTENSVALSGYTVFGRVRDPGMTIVEEIANLTACNKESDTYPAFKELPTYNYDPNCAPGTPIPPDNLVFVNRIPNVAATPTDWQTMLILTAGVDMSFSSIRTAPKDEAARMLASFSAPKSSYVNFNNGIHAFSVSGISGPTIVTMRDGAPVRPTHYYAYGKTQDNQTPHWYDFSYDSATRTGAEIQGDRILLHFVDGQRGDDDLDSTNNTITHIGAQVVLGPPPPTLVQSDAGGCSITTNKSSQWLRGGDWLLVSLFLVMLGLMRRRAHGDRDRNATSN